MRQIWSRMAEAYAPFNVNVTTVTPLGTPATDPQRQAFYDGRAQLMHTVIGGDGSWQGGPIGISATDVAKGTFSTVGQNGGAGAGMHTNWTFPSSIGTVLPGRPASHRLDDRPRERARVWYELPPERGGDLRPRCDHEFGRVEPHLDADAVG